MTLKIRPEEVFDYHAGDRAGKIEVVSSKPCTTQRELSLAYTPGVAEVCRAIEAEAQRAFDYTARGNLVAVISNGTAVLGLGDIGPLAGKPVMEGKGVLFKRFADVDVFDIEIAEKDPKKLIEIIAALEPTFGGINLEDIKAPECFQIEEALIRRMDIPVFHDDQHGTAIIAAAGLINALEISGRNIGSVKKVVVCGAGAAAVACTKLFIDLGLPKESVWMYDSKGLVHRGRNDLNEYKTEFAQPAGDVSLADGMRGAEIFIGVSVADQIDAAMIKSMAANPIVFAMANPDPEIPYPVARAARADIIMATGRSDYPNQINNVLGFPFIFRGALDVRARQINTAMKLAASRALAELAREPVPENVVRAYGGQAIAFGPDYVIPKPFDHRVLLWVAPAVAKAAMETGVARRPIADFDAYVQRLERLLGPAREVIRMSINRTRAHKKPRVVFADGYEDAILKSVELLDAEGFCTPVLLGPRGVIEKRMAELNLAIDDVEIINPLEAAGVEAYADAYWQDKQKQGVTRQLARKVLRQRNYFGAMMVARREADIFVDGYAEEYFRAIEVAEQIIGLKPGVTRPVGVSAVVFKNRLFLFADTAVNVDPTPADLCDIARFACEPAPLFDLEPRVAFLSFADYGAAPHHEADKVRQAVQLLRDQGFPHEVDGEMTVDVALDAGTRSEFYPFSSLSGDANVLVFPNLAAAHIATRLLARVGGAEVLGPVHRGFRQPVVVLRPNMSPGEIYNIVAMAAGQEAALDGGAMRRG